MRHPDSPGMAEPGHGHPIAFNENWGWDGLPNIKNVTVASLGISYDLPRSAGDGEGAAERAMEVAGLLYVLMCY